MYTSQATWALLAVATILPFAFGDVVLDIEGQSLVAGSEYNILPLNGGGLGLKMRNNSCPFYVAYNKNEDGLPVVFTPYVNEKAISEGADLKVEFAAVTICVQSTRWRLEHDSEVNKFFIYTGSSSSRFDLDYFQIIKSEGDDSNVYELSFCPSVCDFCKPVCGSLGIYTDQEANQWLVIDSDDNPLKVQFKRA